MIGNETTIGGMKLGGEVCDFLASGIQEVKTIQNDSDYLSVIDECVYSYLEYEDYDCSGSSVEAPGLVLCFYPMERSEETLEFYSECDMIGEEVFAGHYLNETVIIPEGIRIIGEGAFANLPQEVTVKLPKSLEYMDQDVFSGTTATVQIDKGSSVICNPYTFRGLTTRELVIPDFLSFYYYNKSDEELKNLVEFSVSRVENVVVEKEAKSAIFFQEAESKVSLQKVKQIIAKRSRTGKVTVTWKWVSGAEKYVVQGAENARFTKSLKRKVTAKLNAVFNDSKIKFVKVRAKNGSKKGKWSKVVRVRGVRNASYF